MTIKGCSAMVMAVGLDGGDGREEMEGGGGRGARGKAAPIRGESKANLHRNRRKNRKKRGIYLKFFFKMEAMIFRVLEL